MDHFSLSPKEFLLLCAGIGVTEVYGIEDGYKDVDLSDLSSEIRTVQQSLEKKGYMESDFDGNSTMRSDLMDYVTVCAMCQKLISANFRLKSGQAINLVYYFLDGKVVKSEKKDGFYALGEVNPNTICDEIKCNIQLSPIENPLSFTKVHIPQKELDKMKKLILSGNRKDATLMLQKHFDAGLTDIILHGLEEKENFYSVVAIDFTAETDNIKNVMFIGADTVNVKMQPTVIDLVTEVEFESVDSKTIYHLIDSYLNSILATQTTGGGSHG